MLITPEIAENTPLTDVPAQTESEIEARLTAEIRSLWAAHQETKAATQRSIEELKTLRRDLGEKLVATGATNVPKDPELAVIPAQLSVGAASPTQRAGINRHEAGNARVLRERSSEPLGSEFCVVRREAHGVA